MSYRVTYEKRRKEGRGRSRLFAMILTAWMVFLLMVNVRWPEGWGVLREFLFPDAASKALHTFASDLQSGIAFQDALETFCHEVVQGAG